MMDYTQEERGEEVRGMTNRHQSAGKRQHKSLSARPALLVMTLALAGQLSTPASAEQFEARNVGPVQVHIFESPRDRHPEPALDRLAAKLTDRPNASGSAVEVSETIYPLQLPLRAGVSNNDPVVFTISAFVDHDEANPDQLRDYNCGDRTYDTDDSNHNGTDFQGTTYSWLTMANDGMVVIAAADGVIFDKHDGEPDQQCAFDENAEANYIVLQHPDGTGTLYAHLKKGSVTPKQVGDSVEQGDYLGVVGSSGFSTGPHLHLGAITTSGEFIDPYAGSCNLDVDDSWWEEQEPYYVKSLVSVATHSAAPEYPPCPQQEVPHLQDVFDPTDTIFFSVTVRDFEDTDSIDVQLVAPNGQIAWQETFSQNEFEFAPNLSIAWGLQFSAAIPAGQYTWRATYAGRSMSHIFYVGSGPSEPVAVPANNAYTGLWYDVDLDGEGFNVVTADSGTIFYFYGNDNRGNRLWLISDVVPGPIQAGSVITVRVYESTGGTFPSPVQSSRGLSAWGTLSIRFTDCENGAATLSGADGNKTSALVKLVGISGAACNSGAALADAGWSGLWFDPTKDGEGYNLLVTPVGRILYFYGFKSNGKRLWLISDVMGETLAVGATIETTVYEATRGIFSAPVPSGESLVVWGTAKITLNDCNSITVVLTGSDGSKTSQSVRLTGIIGLSCTN
jgi:murein DD-endopeptidase MepM/ murein hydrolase activator NlpD